MSDQEFIEKSVRDTELATIKWCLGMLKKAPVETAVAEITRYMEELENE